MYYYYTHVCNECLVVILHGCGCTIAAWLLGCIPTTLILHNEYAMKAFNDAKQLHIVELVVHPCGLLMLLLQHDYNLPAPSYAVLRVA